MGFVAQGDFLHFLGCGHLEVQGRFKGRHQRLDVSIADMAAVFAQMGSDAIGPGRLSQLGRADGIWRGPAACIAQGGHVVDVDAKSQFVRHFRSLLTLSARCALRRGGQADALTLYGTKWEHLGEILIVLSGCCPHAICRALCLV